jgi:hypothetical protein
MPGRDPAHVPPLQVSLRVQGFPSSHDNVLFVWTQPEPGLHVSFVQTFPSEQLRRPTHEPPAHASPTVQAFPSLHGDVLFVWTQPPDALHASSVQGSPSSQLCVF